MLLSFIDTPRWYNAGAGLVSMEDKFRVLRHAERFVVNRQYEKAVEEYRKIVEAHGEDPAVLNTLGDLLLKTHRRQEALECFHRVAEIFTQGGFVSKAIAIYRKIAQLAPEDKEVVQRLAELFTRRGLRFEALKYWDRLATMAGQEGNKEQSITACREMVSLAPDEPDSHFRLATALAPLDPREAAAEYVEAAQRWVERGDWESARRAADEALALDVSEEAQRILEEAEAHSAPQTGETAETTEKSVDEVEELPSYREEAEGQRVERPTAEKFASPNSREQGEVDVVESPSGLAADEMEQESAFFDLDDRLAEGSDEAAGRPEPEVPAEEVPAGRPAAEVPSDDALKTRLDEVDLYIKLEMRGEAEMLLRELLTEHPHDERVRIRVERLGLGSEAEVVSGPGSSQALQEEVDAALEDVFFEEVPEALDYPAAGEAEAARESPNSLLDLAEGYLEIGLLEDAAVKYEEAYHSSSDAEDPMGALVCCSKLVSIYLRLGRYEKVVEWADIGLSLPAGEEDLQLQLEYDRSKALEEMGELEESLAGYLRILQVKADFEDVADRVRRLEERLS